MERFISLLLSGIMSGSVSTINLQDTGRIQEQYVIESYFHRVDEQAPLVYKSGRVLGKKFYGIKGGNITNRTDCSGMLVGHMAELDIVDGRYIKGMEGLDSDTLRTLGTPKKRSDVVRGDRVYMEFPSGQRHIAVACDDRGENIYDLYLQDAAVCRPQPPVSTIRYASNGAVELLRKREVTLQQTTEVLDYFQRIKDEANQNGSGYLNSNGIDGSTTTGGVASNKFIDVVVDRVKSIVTT